MLNKKEILMESIDILILERLKNIGRNYYVDGKITAVNTSDYTVLINGESYTLKARTGLSFIVNDIVQIIVKNGDWSKKFIDDYRLGG